MVVRRWFDAREWLIERDAYVCAAGDVHGSAHRGRRGWVLDVYGVHRPDGVLQRERGCDDDPDGGCAQVGDLEAAILAAQVLGCGARVHGRCVKPTRKNKRSQVHPAGERAQNDHAVRDRVEQLHLHPQAGHRDLPVDRDPGGRHVPDRHIPDHGLRGRSANSGRVGDRDRIAQVGARQRHVRRHQVLARVCPKAVPSKRSDSPPAHG